MERKRIKKHLQRNERELINLIKNCPAIYDSTIQAFRTPEIREKAWESIADELNASGKYFYVLLIYKLILYSIICKCNRKIDVSLLYFIFI